MNLEAQIHLNKFKPRGYQIACMDAIENKGYKRVLAFWPRRAGKDVMALNTMIRQAIKKPGVYFYLFPEYAQARKAIFTSLTSSGEKFLDYIPKEVISKINQQEMRVVLYNDSVIQFMGSDNFDSLRGTNPSAIVYSEYAYQDPRAAQALSPALKYNDGWAMYISTVRGKNHAYELFNIAKANPEHWYAEKLTIEDTLHISAYEVEQEIARGEISWDLAQAEYYNNFFTGIEGSYYAKYIDKMRLNGQIADVPYEAAFKVHSSWDIGNDCTSIILFQICGQIVRIIDYYENSGAGHGLEHYVKVLQNKPYVYGRHIFPHDMSVTEWGGSRNTRLEKARQLGLQNCVLSERKEIDDGIEAVRSTFSRMWIDQNNCKKLISALENYRQEYDAKRNTYKGIPLHDWSSHPSDAMRYLCLSLSKVRDALTPEQLDKRFMEAKLGANAGLPAIFRDDLPDY